MENKTTNILHIATYSGRSFDLVTPTPEMVCIEDIAHSLAYQCRYTGHTRHFYSVAQHCVLMAENPDLPGDPMRKLLHDADEAYLGDIAKPWKRLLWVQRYELLYEPIRDFERKVQDVIGLALGVNLTPSAEVKESDVRMAATEVRDLMPAMGPDFLWGYDLRFPAKEKIIPWGPGHAEQAFLNTYTILNRGRAKV